ncbi:hypothetical protein F5Y07DRAFT_340042 [Xylaria sp. FL0933]|nr:hypothetical protein F5Y07DRAFT_340042 [Xylaria sp. FL0933]
MRCAVFLSLVGLATAFPGQVVERQLETSTVTAAAHPMTFWPLAHLAATETPLTYDDPPVPSRVPPSPHAKDSIAQADANANPCSSASLSPPVPKINSTSTSTLLPTPPTPPTSLPSSSSTTKLCTVIKGSYPTSTLPAFCRPTLYANAPSLFSYSPSPSPSPSAAHPVSTAVVTMSANSVPDKVSCCAACATYYNCFAWRFVPSYVGTPSERLPGGFDPWRHGNCEIVYHTGVDDINMDMSMEMEIDAGSENGEGDEEGDGDGKGGVTVTMKGAPQICPNGRLRRVLNGTITGNTGSSGSNSGDSGSGGSVGVDKWFAGLYFNGWNEGACAADLGSVVFLEGVDPGVGDGSQLCDV